MSFSIEQEKLYIGQFLDAIGFSHLRAYLTSLSRKTLSGLDRQAVDAWEGLNVSPFATVDIPVKKADGSMVIRRTSVADLGLIGEDTRAARLQLESVVMRAVNNGILSRDSGASASIATSVYEGKRVNRDPRMLDPKLMLELIPATRGLEYNATPAQLNPLGIPPGYPRPKLSSLSGLYATPKLVDARAYPNAALMADIEACCNALSAYLKSRNCNPAIHPVITAMLQPVWPVAGPKAYSSQNRHNIRPDEFNFSRAVNNWSRWSKRYYSLTSNPQPSAFEFVYDGPRDGRWLDSCSKRLPTMSFGNLDMTIGAQGSAESRPSFPSEYLHTTSCDAVLDYVAIFQAASAILELGKYDRFAEGVTVDLYASCQAYNELLIASYRQIGRPYGSNFGEFQRMLALEAKNREIKNRSGALAFTGARLQASGDDAADIGAGIMGTVTTALALGTAVGGPYGAAVGLVAGVILGTASVIGYLLGSDAPRDPSREQLRFQGGPLVWGLTPQRVIDSWPVIRYQR